MPNTVVVIYSPQRHWPRFTTLVATMLLALLALPRIARADWHPISPPLPDYANNFRYLISPDSQTVAYASDMMTDSVVELYTVPISETTPTRINPPFVEGGTIVNHHFEFTPDSESLLYLADAEVDQRVELYIVPRTGGTALKLSGAMVAGGNVQSFLIDEGTGRVVYLADQETNEVFELWSVALSGGTPVKLNQTFVAGGNVYVYKIDPISDRVVYTADAEVEGKFELYSTPIAGGTAHKLNPPIVLAGAGASGVTTDFEIHPGIPVVVFIAREGGAVGDNLYSIATAGNPATALNKLNFDLAATQRLVHFKISPLGDRVVYVVGTNSGSTLAYKGKLYTVPVGGGDSADISDTPDPLFGAYSFDITMDGSRVIYGFQDNNESSMRLVSSPMLGPPVNLFASGSSSHFLSFVQLSDDSDWVAYGTSSGSGDSRIYVVPPAGGGAVSHGLGTFGQFTPDSSRIVYTKRVDAGEHTDLFSAQVFGGGVRNLSDLAMQGFVRDPLVSPDGEWVVFTAYVDGANQIRVSDGEVAQPPITGLTASNNSPKVINTPVAFSTVITGGESISYTWEFGDEETGSGAAPTHVYDAGGTYTATVTAVSSANTMTASTTVYVGNAIVEVTDNAYTPTDVTIPHGGTVVWTLKEGNHSVTADDGSFEQPAGTDWAPFVHTFDHALAAGGVEEEVITYHCSVHGTSMAGSVTLQGEIVTPGDFKVLLPIVDGE